MSVSQVWSTYISPYFQTGAATGTMPPISISFTPYSAVINMRTGQVIAMDTSSVYLSVQDILNAVNQANQ